MRHYLPVILLALALTLPPSQARAAGHVHDWDEGRADPPGCVTEGTKTFVCKECGESRTETLPAAGHQFQSLTGDPMDDFVCPVCDSAVTPELKEAYDAVTALDGKTLPQDIQQTEAAIKAYLEAEVTGTLDTLGWFTSDLSTVRYTEPRPGIPGAYVYTVTFRSFGRITPLADVTTEPLTLVIPASPEETPETYPISVGWAEYGDVSVNTRYAEPGEAVTVHIFPYHGYALRRLEVRDALGQRVALRDLDGWNYRFIMPSSGVTVEADFEELEPEPVPPEPREEDIPEEPPVEPTETPDVPVSVPNPPPMTFSDVHSGQWFYSSVDYVWTHGLMSGVSAERFAPEEPASRAMIWTILARMNGVPTDAAPGTVWYGPGMAWAMEQGVSDGTAPHASVTREQLATMLWRNAGAPGTTADISAFSDSGRLSGYALEAVGWAYANGILQGTGGRLNPRDVASRAEVAAMLERVLS